MEPQRDHHQPKFRRSKRGPPRTDQQSLDHNVAEQKPAASMTRNDASKSSHHNNNKKQNKNVGGRDTWLKRFAGDEFASIRKDDLQADAVTVSSASGFEVIGSYNWVESSDVSIYVPGAPPTWTQVSLPITLPEDKGGRFIDQNAHRVPDYPFEPLFKAVGVMTPDFDFDKIDFVANRNSLRNLLNFVSGKVFKTFRIDLNMVHNTLFLTRREQRTREVMNAKNLGFGHNFEQKFTIPQQDLANSTSHHRVARYKLGDLDCVVRYEVDAWIPEEGGREVDTTIGSSIVNTNNDDQLLASLQGLSLTESAKKKGKATTPRTQILQRGTAIESSRLAELKTRSREPNRSDFVPQMWFGRIPYLALAVHEKGTFNKVSITETSEDFRKFEETQQDRLRKLVSLIKLLRRETMSRSNKACVVVCEHKVKPVRLQILNSTSNRGVLPLDMLRDHWSRART